MKNGSFRSDQGSDVNARESLQSLYLPERLLGSSRNQGPAQGHAVYPFLRAAGRGAAVWGCSTGGNHLPALEARTPRARRGPGWPLLRLGGRGICCLSPGFWCFLATIFDSPWLRGIPPVSAFVVTWCCPCAVASVSKFPPFYEDTGHIESRPTQISSV